MQILSAVSPQKKKKNVVHDGSGGHDDDRDGIHSVNLILVQSPVKYISPFCLFRGVNHEDKSGMSVPTLPSCCWVSCSFGGAPEARGSPIIDHNLSSLRSLLMAAGKNSIQTYL